MMRCIRREQFFCFYLSMMRRLIGQVKPRIIIIHLWLVKMVEKTIMKEAEFSLHHGYGSMMFLEDGRLIVYNYNLDDEYNLSYVLSEDKGMSWGQAGTTFVAKKIRNPQVVGFEHLYFLHGRSGNNGEQAGNFVLYCSEDGIHWDEGRYLKVRTEGLGAYSNNLVIGKGTSHEKLLIQASHAYKDNQTNVLHWQIIKRKV